MNELCRIDCVSQVRHEGAARHGVRVKVHDPASGTIDVTYGPSDKVLPLRVETTARGAAQCELVASYFRTRL